MYIYIYLGRLLLEILFICHTSYSVLVYATFENVCMVGVIEL